MRILIDMTSVQPANGIQTNGGGEYAYRIFYELLQNVHESIREIHVMLSQKKGKNVKTLRLCQEFHIVLKYYSNLTEFEDVINNGNYEKIFFPVCYPEYSEMKINRNLKVIAVIHDLSLMQELMIEKRSNAYMIRNIKGFFRHMFVIFFGNIFVRELKEKHRQLFNLSDYMKIITVSYYSRNVMEFLLEKKVDYVLYTPSKKRKYFLLINASRWLKNNLRVIKVLDRLFSTSVLENLHNMKVLVCGITPKYLSFYQKKIKNKNHFILTDFVEEEELEVLYKNAFAFVFPSLLEGFGMPPSEALKYETMCLCSTSTSLPEIYRDSVIYFEPENDTSIAVSVTSLFDIEYVNMVRKRIHYCTQMLREKQEHDLKKICEMILE